MNITPYLFFEGRCEEVLAFYHQALGAETTALMRYEEAPDTDGESCPVSEENKRKIMHSSMRIGEATILASDGHCSGRAAFQGVSLTLQPPDEAAARRMFTALRL